MSGPLVVARYRDGRLVKGTSMDVSPEKPRCHIQTSNGERIPVELGELKALFFVKTLEGNSKHQEAMEMSAGDRRSLGSAIVAVVFEDGEQIVGFTNRYPPRGSFYFITPVDSRSNNLRVLVNQAAVRSVYPLAGVKVDEP
jgi:hypothetical protein